MRDGAAADVPPGPPAAEKDRRVLRAFLRWTAAVVVFAAVGAGTAYGITRMERTEVPGLATQPDGRWEYPELTKPPLPAGSPGPLAPDNASGAHYADLRALVLPAPAGATQDTALRGKDGWLATKDFLAEYADEEERQEFSDRLLDDGLRHIAARGWTTPDGTRTRIYLLRFGTAAVVDGIMADDMVPYGTPAYRLRGTEYSDYDDGFPQASEVKGVQRTTYAESEPYGDEMVRHAYLAAGDTLALVVQSHKGGTVAEVPFRQTVVLQSQLLG
ncbi:hypothetical protein JS756_13540 [Streptomyces actuosus]|uniref:Uncharacterized protein n=1 Tax=Streptomyces actuosus TaxID=1885 RepID=A0ABS2VPT2_STRAS|nr:hypothetical protein [Streptomyces actuosus]MBN0045115.1 hypothetical protein [Streptomyces actuosus]